MLKTKPNNNLIAGITISGDLTIAHYLIVIKQLLKLQNNHNLLLFVADLHAVTIDYDVKLIRKRRLQTLATYYACGFDPKTVFVQSDIYEHSMLYFLLARYASVGELKRMTQFKSKTQKYGQTAGLFNYPLLMAADILLYDANVVVGPDQKQHVELTRNLALKINNYYNQTVFKLPNLITFDQNHKIRDLQNPTQKMSKSQTNVKGIIFLHDSPAIIRQKLAIAVTDSENKISFNFTKKPGVSNLILLYALMHDLTIRQAVNQLSKLSNYYELKMTVADAIIDVLKPLQKTITEWLKHPDKIFKYRQIGKKHVHNLAKTKFATLAKICGFDWEL